VCGLLCKDGLVKAMGFDDIETAETYFYIIAKNAYAEIQ